MEKLFQITLQALILLCLSLELVAGDNATRISEEANQLRKTNPRSAIELIETELEGDELTDKERGELFYLQGLIYHKDLSDFEVAIGNFYNSLRYSRSSKNHEFEYRSLFYLALGYKNLFHYDYAITYYQEALQIKGLDSSRIRSIEYNTARVLMHSKEYAEAKGILARLCDYYEHGDQEWLMLTKAALALTQLENKEYDAATASYLEVLALTELNGDYAGLKSKSVNSLGFIKLKQREYEEAERFLLDGLALKGGSGNLQSVLMSYLNLGELYKVLGKPTEAIRYYQLGSALDKSAVNHLNLIEALEELAAMAKAKNDIAAALGYQERISNIQKPYVALSERLEKLHEQYKAERVKFMNDKLELQAKMIAAKNRNLLVGSIFFVLLLSAFGVLIVQYRKLKVDVRLIDWLRRKHQVLNIVETRYSIDLGPIEQEIDEV